MGIRVWLGGCLCAAIAAGCGDDGSAGADGGRADGAAFDGSAPDGPRGSTDAARDGGLEELSWALDDLCESRLQIGCEAALRCGSHDTMDACREQWVAMGVVELCEAWRAEVRRGREEGRVEYREPAARACYEKLFREASCDQIDPPLRRRASSDLDPCGSFVEGRLEPGDTCYGSSPVSFGGYDECAGGTCIRDELGCRGTCVAWQSEGDSCEGAQPCAPELYCLEEECVARKAEGQLCGDEVPCNGGLGCIEGAEGESRCTRLLFSGSECDRDEQCRSRLCIDGACRIVVGVGDRCLTNEYCPAGALCIDHDADPVTPLRCAAPKESGEECNVDSDCSAGLQCLPDDEDPDGPRRCMPLAEEGDPCEGGVACAEGLRCVDDDGDVETPSRCVPLAEEGDSCDRVPCADGLYCETEARECMAPGDVGDACITSNHCEPDLFCDASECQPRSALGEECVPGSCLETLRCEDGTCVARAGRACSSDDHCTAELVCVSGFCGCTGP